MEELLKQILAKLDSTAEKKQMTLDEFEVVYGIPRTTTLHWCQYQRKTKFPAYKLYGKWYVDIPKYVKWREVTHVNCTA